LTLLFGARYNSAVFTSLTANEYQYYVVSKDFTASPIRYGPNPGPLADLSPLESLHTMATTGQPVDLVPYSPEACMALYAKPFVSNVRNLLLLTTSQNEAHNLFTAGGGGNPQDDVPWDWICTDFGIGKDCTLEKAVRDHALNWTVDNIPVTSCLVEPVVEQCRLSFSLPIMIVVIFANMMKAGTMFLTYWMLYEPTLVTIGDAVASFLDNPDRMTAGLCISSKFDIENWEWIEGKDLKHGGRRLKRWSLKRHSWFGAASVKRWITCTAL